MIKNNTEVEIVSKQFEFSKDNKPTGHYARGIVTEYCASGQSYVRLHTNGRRYKVNNNLLFEVVKVKCINNEKLESHLTIGKEYDAIDLSSEMYRIYNDKGEQCYLMKERFEIV